jgi:hypothetical protein
MVGQKCKPKISGRSPHNDYGGNMHKKAEPFLTLTWFFDKSMVMGNKAKRIVINFHSYNVYLSGCLIFEPVPYFHHGTVSFLDLPGDYNGLRPKFSLRNPDLSVLPFFPDQRGLA